ncbi:TylF/MycF/NovP-related O-methyltransferase [Bradyrhizobium sp.]|uniref:TylF/MycF/NovP-related O-methyltransferase n=1 Tax=Bradyrhizobium sp. TaxID=376 RepID=UPI0040382A3B
MTGIENTILSDEISQGDDARFLSPEEHQIFERLFASDFTLDEGLKLYHSVISNGRLFPKRWEMRILELGLAADPSREDMRERLAFLRNVSTAKDVANRQALLDDANHLPTEGLSDDEKIELMLLLGGRTSLASGLKLHSSLTARGIPFPMEWEEKILELVLAEDPERPDVLGRYRRILLALGKSVPATVERRYEELAREEEYGTDYQQAAAQYNEKTGFDDTEPEFRALAEQVRAFTMTSFERMYALYKAVDFIEQAGIPGSIVECGVWRGGSMMVVAHRLLALGRCDRDLYLFDTYEGLPRPDEVKDVDVWGNRAIDGWLPRQTGDESSHWAEASLEEVHANLLSTGYPEARLHLVKGMVERTIPAKAPVAIALLRLDTDWYASTKHEMEQLFPRLARNGILIIDDYGHFEGARQAVDEYIAEHRLPVLLNRIDYSGRLIVKTC